MSEERRFMDYTRKLAERGVETRGGVDWHIAESMLEGIAALEQKIARQDVELSLMRGMLDLANGRVKSLGTFIPEVVEDEEPSTHSVIVKCADEVRQGDYINVDGSARYVSSVSRRGDGNVHLYFYDLRLNKTYRPYEMVEVMIP